MSQRLKAWVHDFFINPRLSWELLLLGVQCSFELLTPCSTWNYFFHMRIFPIPSSVVQFIRIVSYYKFRIAYCTTTTSFLCNSPEKNMSFPTRFLQCEENNIIHLCIGFSIHRNCIQHYSITKEFHYNLAYCYVNSGITQTSICSQEYNKYP